VKVTEFDSPFYTHTIKTDPTDRVPILTGTSLGRTNYFSSAFGYQSINVSFDLRLTTQTLRRQDWIKPVVEEQEESFLGVDRKSDPVRLAGQTLCANDTLEYDLFTAMGLGAREGAKIDAIYLPPAAYYRLVNSTAVGRPHSKDVLGNFKLTTPYGYAIIFKDPTLECEAFLVQSDTWRLSNGQLYCTAPGYNVRLMLPTLAEQALDEALSHV